MDPEAEYECIRDILNRHDFANLKPGDASPLDEYELESALLCASINPSHGVTEAFDTVAFVFGYSFGLSEEDPHLKAWSVDVAQEIVKSLEAKDEYATYGPEAVVQYLEETGVASAVNQIKAMAQENGLEGTVLPHAVAKVLSTMSA